MSCGVGHRRSSDPALLWLWYRRAAAAPTGPLGWELPCALQRRREEGRERGREGKRREREGGRQALRQVGQRRTGAEDRGRPADSKCKGLWGWEGGAPGSKGSRVAGGGLGKSCHTPCSAMTSPTRVYFCFVLFSGPHPRHMEVPRLGVQSELHLQPTPQLTAMLAP